MIIAISKPTPDQIKQAESWPEWSKEPSEFPYHYDQTETCHILSGRASVTAADGQTFSFGAGDWVIFPKGLEATWKITETIRKKYHFS